MILKILKVIIFFTLVWQGIPRMIGSLLRYLDIEYNAIVANELCILTGSLIIIFFHWEKEYGLNIRVESTLRIVLFTLAIQSLGILSFALLITIKAPLPQFVTNSTILSILSVYVVLPAICEEVFMRGLIQEELSFLEGSIRFRSLNLSTPVIVTAFLFGVMHLFPLDSKSFLNFLAPFIIGILAGYYKEKSGSLFPAFMVHASSNFWGGIPAKLMYMAFG
jgi:membrane protease YdiL (CAAX protease family)